MVIQVDSKAPVVRLLPLQQGYGEYAGQLLIRWIAEDEQLAETPVQLSWSTQPQGPWTAITKPLPNTGQFVWKYGGKVSSPVYVQVSVRDAAGNVRHVSSLNPESTP